VLVCRNISCRVNIPARAITPRNTVGVLGENATLPCYYGNSPLSWTVVSAGNQQSSAQIVSNCVVLEIFKDYFDVDTTGGACNLIINNVTLFHAGLYTCQEVVALDRPSSAQIVVIGQ